MSLTPLDDMLAKEIESWQGFSEILRSHDRELFTKMLKEAYQLNEAIKSKGELYSTESLLMGLVFLQHKIIHSLMEQLQNKN